MDDLLNTFAGKIEEPIGHSIAFLSVLMSSTETGVEPCIFWLKTEDAVWHRFFIDAWVPHWAVFNEEEKTDLIEEDLQNEIIDGTTYYVKDLMKEFDLKNKKIVCVDMSYSNRNELFFGNLKIRIDGSKEINVYDYGDEIDTELYMNKTLIEN
jgi:hypothetical protein